MTIADTARAALPHLRQLAQDLFPGGAVRGDEYVARNHVRGDRTAGSFSVNLRTGAWSDFADAAARGGDAVSLWAYARGVRQSVAAAELDAWLGGAPAAVDVRPPPPPPARAMTIDPVTAWRAADPDGPRVAAWLASRGIDADDAVTLGLVRETTPLHCWQQPLERRAIVRIYDTAGRVTGLRGRLTTPVDGAPKELVPAGCVVAGRLLACGVGAEMLAGRAQVDRVIITEGVPDWLAVASMPQWRRCAERVAVLGVWSGSVTAETMRRLTDAATVILCPHADPAGEAYMRAAAAHLGDRCPTYFAPLDGSHDYADTLRARGPDALYARITAALPPQ